MKERIELICKELLELDKECHKRVDFSEEFVQDPKMLEPYIIRERKKYYALDQGTSGKFLIDKNNGETWTIKAYGQKNHFVGVINELTSEQLFNRIKIW